MALTYFPVVGKLQAVISDSSADDDGNPQIQNISATVWFRPSVSQVYSVTEETVYRLQPIRARTNSNDGILKTIDDETVTLVANSAALDIEELVYRVDFEDVVYDKQPEPIIDSFAFVAPTTATEVDLATVARNPV